MTTKFKNPNLIFFRFFLRDEIKAHRNLFLFLGSLLFLLPAQSQAQITFTTCPSGNPSPGYSLLQNTVAYGVGLDYAVAGGQCGSPLTVNLPPGAVPVTAFAYVEYDIGSTTGAPNHATLNFSGHTSPAGVQVGPPVTWTTFQNIYYNMRYGIDPTWIAGGGGSGSQTTYTLSTSESGSCKGQSLMVLYTNPAETSVNYVSIADGNNAWHVEDNNIILPGNGVAPPDANLNWSCLNPSCSSSSLKYSSLGGRDNCNDGAVDGDEDLLIQYGGGGVTNNSGGSQNGTPILWNGPPGVLNCDGQNTPGDHDRTYNLGNFQSGATSLEWGFLMQEQNAKASFWQQALVSQYQCNPVSQCSVTTLFNGTYAGPPPGWQTGVVPWGEGNWSESGGSISLQGGSGKSPNYNFLLNNTVATAPGTLVVSMCVGAGNGSLLNGIVLGMDPTTGNGYGINFYDDGCANSNSQINFVQYTAGVPATITNTVIGKNSTICTCPFYAQVIISPSCQYTVGISTSSTGPFTTMATYTGGTCSGGWMGLMQYNSPFATYQSFQFTGNCVTPTPTATPTRTPSPTPSTTPSRTPTPTATTTPTRTATPTATSSATSSATATATSSATASATSSTTSSSTSTATQTASRTATPTATSSATSSATSTATRTATSTATSSSTSSATATATSSATFSSTSTATQTASRTATPTATRSATASATSSATATATASATSSATASATSSATSTATRTATATASSTPTSSVTPTATATATNTFANTATTTATLTATSTASATPTNSTTSTASPTATNTTSPTNTATQTTTSTATTTTTPTPTRTPTLTSTSSFTNSATPTPTNSATSTATLTATGTPTNTNTATNTATHTATATDTNTPVFTFTPTNTPTNTASATPSSTPTSTHTPTATNTATNTDTPTNTATFTATATATNSPVFTATPTPTPTNTVTNTATATPTNSFTPTQSPTNTATTTATNTPLYTFTPTNSPTDTPTRTASNTPTNSFTPTSTATQTPTSTPSSTLTPTSSFTATRTATSTATTTATPTPVFTNTPTNTASRTATLTATATASSTASLTPSRTATRTATFSATATDTNTTTPTASPTASFTPTHSFTPMASATPTATFTPTPDVEISKTASETVARGGDNITYSIVLAVPRGPATGVTVTDILPNYLTFQGYGPVPMGGTSYAPNGQTLTWSFPSLSTGSVTLTYRASVSDYVPQGTVLRNNAQVTYVGLANPKTTSVDVAMSLEYTVKIGVYNAAGELVKQIWVQELSQQITNFSLLQTPTITSLHGVVYVEVNGQQIATWDGTNQAGDPVSNGAYYVKVDNIDPLGVDTSVSETVTVSRTIAKIQVNIYNEAGEVVKHLYVYADDPGNTNLGNVVFSSSVIKPTLGTPTSNGTSDLTLTLPGGVTLTWDGTNDGGQIVTDGVYAVEIHWLDGHGGEQVTTHNVSVERGNGPGNGIAVAAPNILNGSSSGTTVYANSSLTLTLTAAVYDVAGELVKKPATGPAGAGTAPVDVSGLASGLYFVVVDLANLDGHVVQRQVTQIVIKR